MSERPPHPDSQDDEPSTTDEAIRRLVESAPMPTPEQMSKLRRLMRPGFERAAAELAAQNADDDPSDDPGAGDDSP
ncbi:hypothetical protein [Actinomadura macra]|uniref:hypothetical protein n=1 Tax=Actinomadura macra TaxID=46164 RepID=UPI000A440324|nr:hypothetical protein [Actinomadura macra]